MFTLPGKDKKTTIQEHSVNSLHNIVIYQKSKCKVCGKIFWESIPLEEESDPGGIK